MVCTLLRRRKNGPTNEAAQKMAYGTLRLFLERRDTLLNNTFLMLAPTEFDFFTYLVQHQDRTVSRDELLQALW